MADALVEPRRAFPASTVEKTVGRRRLQSFRSKPTATQPDPLSSLPMDSHSFRSTELRPVGMIRSSITRCDDAPKQGPEGAPDAWIHIEPWAVEALDGLRTGDELIVITWLHQGRRDVLKVRPRSDPRNPLTGVFATRSPDRPNPLGLHPVTVRTVDGARLLVGPIEAIDGTPVLDIKPVL